MIATEKYSITWQSKDLGSKTSAVVFAHLCNTPAWPIVVAFSVGARMYNVGIRSSRQKINISTALEACHIATFARSEAGLQDV